MANRRRSGPPKGPSAASIFHLPRPAGNGVTSDLEQNALRVKGIYTDGLACGLSLVIGVNGISVRFNIGISVRFSAKR